MTQTLFGLLGWPVGHSVSPPMMNEAFRTQGIDATYVAFAVEPSRVKQAVEGLAALGAGGFNVTIPHKQAVYQLVDDLSEEARFVGAVNTVRLERSGSDEVVGKLGHNTDVSGWWQSVSPHLQTDLGDVVVLGAGGAVRAIVAALAIYAPKAKVTLVARRPRQAEALASGFQSRLDLSVAPWERRHSLISEAQLIVNATPIGMWPYPFESPLEDTSCLGAGQVVQDIVYRPLQTMLLRQAQAQGATPVDGLGMLVYQGAAAFEFWTHQTAPIEQMRAAAQGALGTE